MGLQERQGREVMNYIQCDGLESSCESRVSGRSEKSVKAAGERLGNEGRKLSYTVPESSVKFFLWKVENFPSAQIQMFVCFYFEPNSRQLRGITMGQPAAVFMDSTLWTREMLKNDFGWRIRIRHFVELCLSHSAPSKFFVDIPVHQNGLLTDSFLLLAHPIN